MYRKTILKAALLLACVVCFPGVSCARRPIRALIVTGQNNHNWPVSHRALQAILQNSGLFAVDLAVSPPQGGDMDAFDPDFSAYRVVILDYNGDRWSASTERRFLDYVRDGGGVVLYHAADNAFPDWEEFNRIAALGGWGGRDERSGPYLYWKDGSLVRDTTKGPGGSHGEQREYSMNGRNAEHPVVRGLPGRWIHATDELYDRMRGPANVAELLYTAYADPGRGGFGREEPLVFTVDYGKARIFHLMIGHAGPSLEDNPAMQCTGFQTLLLRGSEWAATGKVRQRVPDDFPTERKSSLRKDYRKP